MSGSLDLCPFKIFTNVDKECIAIIATISELFGKQTELDNTPLR